MPIGSLIRLTQIVGSQIVGHTRRTDFCSVGIDVEGEKSFLFLGTSTKNIYIVLAGRTLMVSCANVPFKSS